MASSYGGLLFIALSSTLLLQFPLITAPPPFSGHIYEICRGGNYTQGSPYQDNLIDLRSSLFSYITPEISKYYSASVGEIPNRVYWVFQCRGDVGSEDCKTCAVTAGREIMTRCPYKKEAVVFYDECWLHYANFSIVSTVQFEPTKYMWNPNNVSDPNPFMAGLSELMEGLVGRAVSATDLFAIGVRNLTTSQKIYGLVQCTQYLSGNDCKTCLRTAVSKFPRCCFGRLGGTVHNPSCNARYETYQFYVDAALPPAPAAPEPNTNTTADFEPTFRLISPMGSTKNRTGTIVGITVPIVLLSIICAFAIIYWRRKRSRSNEDEEFLGIENRPNTFSYSELRNATGDFTSTNKLGEGGFGPVYKGMMSDEKAIAVKKLLVTSHQGKSQFVAEISIISAVQHRNLVKLYGCCIEGENRLLVYEYLKNKSLDQALFGSTALHLDWPTRFNICLGAARGLAYLHEESKPRIVHRDVKASNILLDSELNPKISDFGLAKLYDDKKTHISTRVAGTIGYLAPEYAMRGHLTEKADVFGFGVVALEILCGRPNTDSTLDPEKIYLLERAWTLSETKRGLELVDPTLTSFDEEEAIRMLGISLLCTQASPMMRPSMSRVVAMLTGDIPVSTVTSKPSYLTDWQFNDKSTFMSDDGTSQSNIHFDSSTNATATYGADQSPMAGSQPMLHDVIGNGR